MGTTLRHYIFPEDQAPKRVAKRIVNALIFDQDAISEYANTKMRVLTVMLDNEDGKPDSIFHFVGSIWHFDAQGRIVDGLRDALREAMEAAASVQAAGGSNVVSISPKLHRARLEANHRWEPTQTDIDTVAADIWPNGKQKKLKAAKSNKPKRPPLTYEAKHAYRELDGLFFKAGLEIDRLSEPALKGFVYEANERASKDIEGAPLHKAYAELAQRRLNILQRRRSGKGTWYAVVHVTRWEKDNVGRGLATYHEVHEGREAAVEAGRRMLAEHARHMTETITVEASVVTDAEWEMQRS